MSQEIQSEEHAAQEAGHEELLCYWCEVPVSSDGRCPRCGRRQTRVCFCGQELWPGESVCPNCGADWVGMVKVRRKKRHRGRSLKGALQFTALGIAAALGLTALANWVVDHFAEESVHEGPLPEAPAERLGLAWKTISDAAHAGYAALTGRIGNEAFVFLLGLLGGILGLLFYLRRNGAYSHKRHEDLPTGAPPDHQRRTR